MKRHELKISFLVKFLDDFCPLVDKIIIDNHGVNLLKKNRACKIYLLEYLTRQSSNLNSIRLIHKNDFNAPRFEHSIGLLLRNSLSDTLFITYLNLPNKLKTGLDIGYYESEILKLNADQLVRTFSDNGINDAKSIDKFKKYIKLGDSGKVESLFGSPKTNKGICKIFESQKETKKHVKLYQKWEIYSKYEHYGLLTNFIQTKSLDTLIIDHLISVSFIIRGILLAISNIKEISSEITIDFKTEFNINDGFPVFVENFKELIKK